MDKYLAVFLVHLLTSGVSIFAGLGYDAGQSNDISPQPVLLQNHPNPFHAETVISFKLIRDGKVTLKVFDILGHEVATLAQDHYAAGIHDVWFNGSSLPPGIYTYQLEMNDLTQVRKFVIIEQ